MSRNPNRQDDAPLRAVENEYIEQSPRSAAISPLFPLRPHGPLPGSAARVSTLPAPQNVGNHPARTVPLTVGHLPPRRREYSGLSKQGLPPRPPKPGFESRLGLSPRDNHVDVVATRQPTIASYDVTTEANNVIVSQPAADSAKKALVVELREEKSPKSRSKRETSKVEAKTTTETRIMDDEDRCLVAPEGGAKPGQHNYPCPRCRRCMCPKCRGEVPGTAESARRAAAHCGGCKCPFSADAFVETATCLCCVKGCFYHCSNYEENDTCTDKPCSCKGGNWCCRWSVIGALSLLLPCLCCYPVARGCVYACRSCANCMKPGCRCKEAYR